MEEATAEVLDARLQDWKDQLRADFEQWLATVQSIPDEPEDHGDEAPDIYSFYEQLAASNAESKKANRRTAEAFSQWSEMLGKFDGDLRLLREHMARQPAKGEDTLPRAWALALVEIMDRLNRLTLAFASPPPPAWWGGDARWRKAWETQHQGFNILVSHVEALFGKAGISRINTLHQPFDPATMAAVQAEPNTQWPHQTVIEEVCAGYSCNGETLRVAQVKVAINKS